MGGYGEHQVRCNYCCGLIFTHSSNAVASSFFWQQKAQGRKKELLTSTVYSKKMKALMKEMTMTSAVSRPYTHSQLRARSNGGKEDVCDTAFVAGLWKL